jgi:hypothetical protein
VQKLVRISTYSIVIFKKTDEVQILLKSFTWFLSCLVHSGSAADYFCTLLNYFQPPPLFRTHLHKVGLSAVAESDEWTNTTNTKARHCTWSTVTSIYLCLRISFVYDLTDTTNTKAGNCTQSLAISLYLPISQPNFLSYIYGYMCLSSLRYTEGPP